MTTWLWTSGWFFALGVAVAGGASTTETPPTISQVIEGLTRAKKLTWESASLKVVYERTVSVDEIKTVASGGYLPAEWTIAYRGSMWFVQRRFTKPKGTGKPSDPLIPKEPKTVIFRDGLLLEWDGTGSEVFVDTFKNGRNIFAGLYYPRHLSNDVSPYILKAAGAKDRAETIRKENGDDLDHPFLPEFLAENSNKYRVATEIEEVDGHLCWRVEWPGMDRFWVDAARGYAIVRRVYHWGPGKPERFEYHNSNFREVKAGLWLPFHVTELRYASIVAERKTIWGKVACRSEYEVKDLVMDEVPESLFEMQLPKGTAVADFVRDFHYVVSADNADPFAKAVADGRALLVESPIRRWVIYLNVFCLAVFLVVLLLVRKYRQT